MQFEKTEFIVFDVETTGLAPANGDKIIEIAAVKIKNGKIVESFESLINPKCVIPKEAQLINKITDDMVKDAPYAENILPEIIQFISGGCLVAHNIKFDLDFLCYELSLAGRKLLEQTPAIDTLKMAKMFLPQLSSYRLGNIAQSFGIKFNETHRALADVKITCEVFNRLLGLSKNQGYDKLSLLIKEFSVPKPNFKINHAQQGSLF